MSQRSTPSKDFLKKGRIGAGPGLDQGVDQREKSPSRWHTLLIASMSFAVYANSLRCGFAFDDISAIRDNKDLRPTTPLSQLFVNDFWGQQMTREQSHKSYRPLCVLTFRLNYLIDEMNPMGYHLVNVVMHVIVCILYYRLCNLFMPSIAALISSLSFSVHPIHTEAVTSVVGRAEILSSIFFLLAFLVYIKATKDRTRTDWMCFLLSITLVVMATLSKEQGITAIAICGVYEVFVGQKLKLFKILFSQNLNTDSKVGIPLWLKVTFLRLTLLFASFCVMIMTRLRIMGSQLPVFTKFDNPANSAQSPIRQMTFNFLLPLNSWLILFPSSLCCDWTMGTIPLIESIYDIRNVATFAFYVVFALLVWYALTAANEMTGQVLVISLAFIVFPFLPASNLFFPVGFVVAERILYMPSFGFCMLFGFGFDLIYKKLYKKTYLKRLLVLGLVLMLLFHSIKTIVRNYDWESEYTIFMAGIQINKRNAKLYNNVGHALENESKYSEALQYFLKAVEVQPDDIGAHMNVGRTYVNLNEYELAEQAFYRAKDLLPRARPGERDKARVAPSHLNVFLNLANLIARNKSRLEEADALYRQVIRLREDYTQAYINRGDLLIKMNRSREAQEVYQKALQLDGSNPDIYFNLGVVLLKESKAVESDTKRTENLLLIANYFMNATLLNGNHKESIINLAILLQQYESILSHYRQTLIDKMKDYSGVDPELVYFNLALLLSDSGDNNSAVHYLKRAIEVKNDFRSALFNLALILIESHNYIEAEQYLNQLLTYHPNHTKSLLLIGNLYTNQLKDLDRAERSYLEVLKYNETNIEAFHNLCVVYHKRNKTSEANDCFKRFNSKQSIKSVEE